GSTARTTSCRSRCRDKNHETDRGPDDDPPAGRPVDPSHVTPLVHAGAMGGFAEPAEARTKASLSAYITKISLKYNAGTRRARTQLFRCAGTRLYDSNRAALSATSLCFGKADRDVVLGHLA